MLVDHKTLEKIVLRDRKETIRRNQGGRPDREDRGYF